MTREQRRTAKLEKQCADFNAEHPIGTKVLVKKDIEPNVITNTRSAAYVLSGHSAVIFLEGISGCYSLDRVDPVVMQFAPDGPGKMKQVFP